jgi:hypothetical protein
MRALAVLAYIDLLDLGFGVGKAAMIMFELASEALKPQDQTVLVQSVQSPGPMFPPQLILYKPMPQTVQSVHAWFWAPVLYFLSAATHVAHATEAGLLEYNPGPQFEHVADPAVFENVPAAHGVHEVGPRAPAGVVP